MPNNIPIIWQLSVVQFELGTAIKGIALSKVHSATLPDKFHKHQAFGIIRSYANKPCVSKQLFVTVNKRIHIVTTNNHGKFELWLENQSTNKIEIYEDDACDIIVPIIQQHAIYYPFKNNGIEIISDIDDTVFRSYSNRILKRIFAILFTRPISRKMINYTRCLLINAKDSGIRVNCISRSELNLFHLLAGIFSLNQLNNVIIYLSDYLDYSGLLTTTTKKHFKYEQICRLLKQSPGKRYFLVGDDTQNDIRTYTEIAEQFPGKIAYVLIHKTKSYVSDFQKVHAQRLGKMDVPILYFDDRTKYESSILEKI
jgi:phosphatidate phosphatase APP1